MDNAGCHPEELAGKYSNIKFCFLPANTTSKLQPLDLGIIKNFKAYYRQLLLSYVISKIDDCSTASDVVQSVKTFLWLYGGWRWHGQK